MTFFFLRAKSSIELVGSAPGDSKNRIGTLNFDSAQISCIGYEIGSTYYCPSMADMNLALATRVLSSLTERIRLISMKARISSFYCPIRSARSGMG